jgi:hypothetical protein
MYQNINSYMLSSLFDCRFKFDLIYINFRMKNEPYSGQESASPPRRSGSMRRAAGLRRVLCRGATTTITPASMDGRARSLVGAYAVVLVSFVDEDLKEDGFHGVAPADALGPQVCTAGSGLTCSQNAYGLYNMLGNTWEWTADEFLDPRAQGEAKRVLRGGSYVDSADGAFNHRIRVTTRMGNTPDSASDNVGFRCARSKDAPNREL